MIIILAVTVFILLLGFSARWNWWRKKKDGLPVLMYHKIGHPPKNSKLKKLWVTPEKFSRQMDYLLKHKFSPILFSELENYCENKVKLPENPILITFDDGYEDNYKTAYPILKSKNIKANIFLVHNSIGKHNHWHNPKEECWLPMLNREQIYEMQKGGLIEFGAHTLNHSPLSEIDLETAKCEIEEGKKQLEEKLNCKISSFAYPYGNGAFDENIRKLVFGAGFKLDFSVKQGKTLLLWDKRYPFKRLLIRGDDNMLDFHLQLSKGKSRF